jgi:glycosyltransferase involved in cell wall biosynthesis
MHAPVISIILPTRNRLNTIQRTVARILEQTYTKWELIISDNASEETGKVDYLRSLEARDARIKVHFQQQNIGIHANWIFCIQQCQGRYYIPVTDDDWWGEDTFLEQMLAMHDGKTGSVFPNMCIHYLDTGEEIPQALTSVYGSIQDRYQLCERLVTDGRGVIMVGLIDMTVIAKEEIIGVLNNGLVIAIETVGMNRIARDYPVKFCETVSYHHTAYSGNYCRSYDDTTIQRDRGIATFHLLDDLRLAVSKDPGYTPAFMAQWEKAKVFCRTFDSSAHDNQQKALRKIQHLSEQISSLKSELKELSRQRKKDTSTLLRAVRAWWRNRRAK